MVGLDGLSDIAVLRVTSPHSAADLPPAKFGASSSLSCGDWAIAIGNPVGLSETCTLGIISSTDRTSSEIGAGSKRAPFIQTDAAINPGNSGGPLVNERGEVVGINTCIRAEMEGIGFAIPSDFLLPRVERLIRGEDVRHPFLGVQMRTVDDEMKREWSKDPNLPECLEDEGAVVVNVLPDGPAAKAGLKRWDVLKTIDDQPIKSAKQASAVVEGLEVGRDIEVGVGRGGRGGKVKVKVGDLGERERNKEKEKEGKGGNS